MQNGKAHITMVGTYPIFMAHTKGLSGDSPELIYHIEVLRERCKSQNNSTIG